MKEDYVFKYTPENGWKKMKMSRKDHNRLFEHRRLEKITERYDYFYNEKLEQVMMARVATWIGKLVLLLIYPIVMLIYGLGNWKETHGEYKDLLNPYQRGAFSGDVIRKRGENSKFYDELVSKLK